MFLTIVTGISKAPGTFIVLTFEKFLSSFKAEFKRSSAILE